MWSTLISGFTSFFSYLKIILAITALGLAWYFGYSVEHARFEKFKLEVTAQEKIQEAKNIEILKQQQLLNEVSKHDYQIKLAAIRNFYANSVHNDTSSNAMSGLPATTKGIDAETRHAILTRQCAQTTAQLTSLQAWIKEQTKIQ